MRLFRGSQIRPGIARLARLVTGRPGRSQRDADEQIALHLALRTEQLIAEGFSPDAARAEAERRFGSLDEARRQLHASAAQRDRRLLLRERFDDIQRDIRIALRGLRRSPGFAVTVVVCLALGVGANAASFSLVDEVLLRALPVRDPGGLVNLSTSGPRTGSDTCNQAGACNEVFSYLMYRDLERAQSSFSAIAAHRVLFANMASGDRSAFGLMAIVSGNYFGTLGLKPALGRLLTVDDDRVVGQHPVALLSHAFWATQFGGDPSVVGRRIVVNGYSLTIVGVAPQGFEGTALGMRPLLYVPLAMTARVTPEVDRDGGFTDRRRYWLYLFARLRPGVSLERARDELNRIYRPILADVEAPLQDAMSDSTMARFKAGQIVLADGRHGQSTARHDMRRSFLFLFAMTAIVLLIACANLANLLLARAATRTTEMAIRLSLGASRRRLLAQLLTESSLLALFGGVASLGVVFGLLELIRSIIPPSGGISTGVTLGLELRTSGLLFAAGVSFITVLAFGLFPALHGTRGELLASIRAGGVHSATRPAERFRTALVVGQIALSTALLISAGLFARSLRNISHVDLGLRANGIASFGLAPILNGYDPARTATLFSRVEERLRAIPGVGGAAASRVPLMTDNRNWSSVRVEGFERRPDTDANSLANYTGPGFFHLMGIPLLAGRDFGMNDRLGAPRVAIVNEAFARKFNLGRNPIGRRMAIDGYSPGTSLDMEIVGLARDTKYSSAKGPMPPVFYAPYRQDPTLGFTVFYAKTAGSLDGLLHAIRLAVAELDPTLPVVSLTTMQQQVNENTFMDRMIATLSAGFAALATLLAAVGLYGVLAYAVAQRRREFGVRMALGATGGRVRRMVLGQVAVMGLAGGIVGVAGGLAIGHASESLLFQATANDPTVIAMATIALSVIALVAGYVPAWRASRVNPVQALRGE